MTNEFFTWAMLATYAGVTLATTAVTQLVKKALSKVSPRLISWVVATVILLAATAFTDGITWDNGVMCLINAVVVSLASNGGYDLVSTNKTE